MSQRKPVIIAYDISCNKRRGKVFRCLQTWHLDKQYSLFECLLSQSEAEELFLQLSAIIDNNEDYLLLAWLDNKQRTSKAITKNSRIGFNQPVWYEG